MSERKFIGVLTPSSNTALEPLTSAIVAEVPGLSAHFSRFTVTEISTRQQSTDQFDLDIILGAAKLLADAKVDVICWSGTAASWLGESQDITLCDAIREETGIPATTSVLAINELLRRDRAATLGLVSPYVDEIQQKIVRNYQAMDINVIAEEHLGITVNHAFGLVEPETLARLMRKVAQSKPDAMTVMCTNLRAAQLAAELERELSIPIYDSVAAVVWKAMRMMDLPVTSVKSWGRLFS